MGLARCRDAAWKTVVAGGDAATTLEIVAERRA
jgi:hypothetical protein